MQAPPTRVTARLRRENDQWVLDIIGSAGSAQAVAEWLRQYNPDSVEADAGIAPKHLRAVFRDPPRKWKQLAESVNVEAVQLTPEGSASVFVEDREDRINRVFDAIHAEEAEARNRAMVDKGTEDLVTARQSEVLQLAVALGYYELPHKVTVRELGQRLGLSVGAVSEVLRRAEAAIITSYVDSRILQKWHERK